MAAVTTALSIAGGVAGLGMNVADAIKAKKAKDSAQQAATKAAAQLKGVKEQDVFGSVQVPNLGYELAQQSADRATKGAMEAARGAGAEGVIGATGAILQASNESGLNLAAQADQAQFQRDLYQAQNKSGIEERRAIREAGIYGSELAGAQQAAADAQATRDLAITGAVKKGIGLAGDIYSSTDLYKKLNPADNTGTETLNSSTEPATTGYAGDTKNLLPAALGGMDSEKMKSVMQFVDMYMRNKGLKN